MLKSIFFIVAVAMAQMVGTAAASPPPGAASEIGVEMSPVRIDGAVLFSVRGVAAYTSRERAAAIAGRIIALADERTVTIESVSAFESEQSTDIRAGNRPIMLIFDADAELETVSRQVLARVYTAKVRGAVEAYRRDRESRHIVRAGVFAFGATIILAALLLLIRYLFRTLVAGAEKRIELQIKQLQDISHDVVRTEWIWATIKGGLRTARIILVLLLVFFYIETVLSLFPWTRAYAVPMLDLVIGPLRTMARSVLDYLPKLAFLIVLFLVARYALNLLQAFFQGIQRGRITLTGFDPDWAMPVYKIARLAVVAFTVVVAYPYIPGSESPAFKGLSLFFGIVFSLGSSSSIANIVAGYMVIFRGAFKVGDRVKIGEQVGDVTKMRLQATHLRTIKNEEISVPNSLILNTPVTNYSALAGKGGLILHTSVTIGYDTPWRQVHAMLLLAAERTGGLLKEPKPFMLQTALNDFYVSYELNAYTDHPLVMAQIYSDLHRNIQDAFNEHGVQIMSPHYLGDPAQAKIVPKDRWYQSPAKQDGS
jgi:small-conductance mechanosensitive channel